MFDDNGKYIGEVPIPKAVLDAAHLKLCRRIAAHIVMAMAQSGVSNAKMEERLGEPRGFVMRYLNRLIDGKTTQMREISDLCFAIGVEIKFEVVVPEWRKAADDEAENAAVSTDNDPADQEQPGVSAETIQSSVPTTEYAAPGAILSAAAQIDGEQVIGTWPTDSEQIKYE